MKASRVPQFFQFLKQHFFIKILLWIILIAGIIFATTCLILYYRYPTTSPLTAISDYYYAFTHPHKHMSRSVIAFLPYWRLTDTKYAHFDSLSEIIYFSLTVDGNGDIVKVIGSETEPGWRWWQTDVIRDMIAKTQISGGKFSLTISNLQNKTIEQFLSNSSAQDKLVHTITDMIISHNLDGVNLDFEYDGSPSASLKSAFSFFVTKLSRAMQATKPTTFLSVDLLPSGGRKPGLFDFTSLTPVVDQYILMTYDYYALGSSTAGPIAPLYGFPEKKFLLDVNTTVNDYKKLIPSQKTLLGIPYYGYDWPVEKGSQFMSLTLDQTDENGYPAVISYGRMRGDTDLVFSQCTFDSLAHEPWCWYVDKGTHKDHQVWFENDQSIKDKFSFATAKNLGGVAIWTLGYDKQYNNLWNLLTTYSTKK